MDGDSTYVEINDETMSISTIYDMVKWTGYCVGIVTISVICIGLFIYYIVCIH